MGEVKYTYKDNNLYDSSGHAIMMDWESDWMKTSADIVCRGGGDILNIGFGLGLVDSFIQKHNPKSHTIIECHSDVLNHMKENGLTVNISDREMSMKQWWKKYGNIVDPKTGQATQWTTRKINSHYKFNDLNIDIKVRWDVVTYANIINEDDDWRPTFT